LGNFDHLLSQTFTKFFPVLPSILSKYQFHWLWLTKPEVPNTAFLLSSVIIAG
jgi:hypothetical protein